MIQDAAAKTTCRLEGSEVDLFRLVAELKLHTSGVRKLRDPHAHRQMILLFRVSLGPKSWNRVRFDAGNCVIVENVLGDIRTEPNPVFVD